MEISVVGLGRLGSSFAASVAKSGIPVSGIEIDPDIVTAINNSRAPFDEPYLEEYLRQSADRLMATTNAHEGIQHTDISFVFVNTYRSGFDGYSLTAVESAVRDIGKALQGGSGSHLIVLRSTVMPGDTENKIINWLESESNRTVGDELKLCYWPELTALGDIIKSMESPDVRLVGEYSPTAGDYLEAFINSWRDDGTPIARTGITSAEVAKMSINTYVAMKMSFANSLSRICEGVEADVDEVTGAMAHDRRINGNYFTAGARYGGPCFPHDNIAFEALAERAGTTAPLANASNDINTSHTDWILSVIDAITPDNGTIAVLGLSYKPGVPVTEESQGMELVKSIGSTYDVIGYDPIATEEAKQRLSTETDIQLTTDITQAVTNASTAVIAVQDGAIDNPNTYENITVVDPWRVFQMNELADSVSYLPLGRGVCNELVS